MKVRRVDGETPSGGAYAEIIEDNQGRPLEVVEYDAEGNELLRTYTDLFVAGPGGDERRADQEASSG